jgi:protein-S-isoprenylcysteine O-methyltransferase Ste14
LTLYIVCAVAYFEEPDLVKELGHEYEEYMKKTPRFIPNFSRLFSATKAAKD